MACVHDQAPGPTVNISASSQDYHIGICDISWLIYNPKSYQWITYRCTCEVTHSTDWTCWIIEVEVQNSSLPQAQDLPGSPRTAVLLIRERVNQGVKVKNTRESTFPGLERRSQIMVSKARSLTCYNSCKTSLPGLALSQWVPLNLSLSQTCAHTYPNNQISSHRVGKEGNGWTLTVIFVSKSSVHDVGQG